MKRVCVGYTQARDSLKKKSDVAEAFCRLLHFFLPLLDQFHLEFTVTVATREVAQRKARTQMAGASKPKARVTRPDPGKL